VSLYRLTLETLPRSSPEIHRVRLRLAEVLEWAGRGAESAKVYLDEAQRAPPGQRVDLERAAAEQLLTSGRIDEGAAVLHRVLDALGMRAPRSAAIALFWLVVYRVLLLGVGLRFVHRDPKDVRPEDRVRIDTLYSVSVGFVMVDVNLFYALRKGDDFQVMRAVSLEAGNLASSGGPESRRERTLRAIGQRLAQRSDDKDWQTFVDGTRGIGLFLRGRFKEARDLLEMVSEGNSMQKRSGWQSNTYLFAVDTLMVLGDLREAAALRERLLVDAEQRGDLYTIVNLHTRATVFLSLAADDPDLARRHLHEAMAQWSQTGFLLQHWQAMQYEAEIELYVGDAARGYDRIVRAEPAYRRSLLGNVQVLRVLTWYLRGRCAIASVDAAPAQRAARLAEARRLAKRLAKENMHWASLTGWILTASVANATGDRPGAIAALREVLAGATAAELMLHVAAAKYQLGSLLGGDAGKAMIAQADEEMASRGVRASARMATRLVPGRWGES
jgi:tetratricopeptide (TPR) repeat protein